MSLAITLFFFWMILSQKFDTFHLGLGFFASVGITLFTRKIFSTTTYDRVYPFTLRQLGLIFAYFPWLLIEIVKANIQVAIAVLKPTMDLQLQTFTIQTKLPEGLPRLIFANSITLTPGTVTLDFEEDRLLIHALNDKSAQGLRPSPSDPEQHIEMEDRIAKHFVTSQGTTHAS
ncbi:MAG: Na+/H+ antiporter subunit E [Bdellovibrionota bacterium]